MCGQLLQMYSYSGSERVSLSPSLPLSLYLYLSVFVSLSRPSNHCVLWSCVASNGTQYQLGIGDNDEKGGTERGSIVVWFVGLVLVK